MGNTPHQLIPHKLKYVFLLFQKHSPSRCHDRDAVSLPTTPRASLMLEGPGVIGIPSKTSAFSPRFSSSLPGKDQQQIEFEAIMSSRRYSKEKDDQLSYINGRVNGHGDTRPKSLSSLSSSPKSSPRNLRNPTSNLSLSSSSNHKRRSRIEVADNSSSSCRRNPKSGDSYSSRRSSRSHVQGVEIKPRTELRNSNNSNNIPEPKRRNKKTKPKNSRTRKKSHSDSNTTTSSSDSQIFEAVNRRVNDQRWKTGKESKHETSTSEEDIREEDSVVGIPRNKKMEGDLSIRKFEEVERKLLLLQQRCDLLEQENNDIKKEQLMKSNKKIADLKNRNSALVSVARRLEQKAKSLQQENIKKQQVFSDETKDLDGQKKTFAKIKAKMQCEQSRVISEKDRQIETLTNQLDDLKKAMLQSKEMNMSQDGKNNLAAALHQSQKESLQLQKLAAAGSKKITIRSLSTPVTARQKILEESNRNLRRQVAQLEENYRQAYNGAGTEDLKTELESTKSKSDALEKEVKSAKVQTVNLESQLQIAKVESSDTNIQLNELRISFNQLHEEYNTVHEQLSVAITERDAAVKQCKDSANKISQMEQRIKYAENHIGDGDTGMVNSKVQTQYQLALEKLQAKVFELEKQCVEQNETNRLLNEQLMSLMKNTNHTSLVEEKDSQNLPDENSPVPLEQVAPLANVQIDVIEVKDKGGDAGQENRAQLPAFNYQVGGNEDTEVEDFIEEELTQTMDNNDAGKLRVYIAKYTYNPFEGPNECPEAELPLVAGDYVYVYGAMDEDGFFEGELMNGRRGLVPSNFLEPVHDGFNGKSPFKPENSGSKCTSSEVSQSESIISSCTSLGSGRMSQRGDISDSNTPVVIHGVLPYPKKLRIDKQLGHSLIIGWTPPQLNDGETIDEYHIVVNGEFKTAVSGIKQKAVVENIHHEQAHRISVCAVSQWGISDESLCVLSHGRGSNLAPTSVRMEKVGTSNARVAWTPSSSQLCHIVMVEEECIERSSPRFKNPSHMAHMVPPPAYRFTFGNLRPNVGYKVTVNVKGSPDEPRSFTRFTTPEAGPPDPPLSVQVEECPNANYLLITWLPVTLNTLGTSNGVVVKGYSIHVAETKVCEVQSPTIDQCTVRVQTLADAFSKQLSTVSDKNLYHLSKPSKAVLRWNKHVPPSVTIKTHAVNGQESDHSDPCIVSQELYSRILDLIKDNAQLISSSPSPRDGKTRKRPPLLRSVESTDVDVSFSSDISIPGLHTPKVGDVGKDGRRSAGSSHSGKSHLGKTKVLQQTRIVPSIEITHDTSSEEDPAILNGLGSRSSSSKSLSHRQLMNNEESKIFSGPNSPKSKPKNQEDRDNHKQGYRGSDNDDAASVSSSHTSSSAGADALKHGNSSSVAHRAARVIQQHKLQRGESAEYSNPEDCLPFASNGSKRNLNPPNTEKRIGIVHYSPDQMHRHQHKHHHNIRRNVKRPHSVASDDHSQGSHHSHSSSRHGHGRLYHGRANGRRDIVRQSTMSSQSGSEFASEIESTYPIDIDKTRVGLFVALYPYDPQLMSPNTDSYEEELSFTEGQLIKVYGSKDEDGFYYGETHTGMRGYVPCNMVSQVEVESMQMLLDLHERGHLPSASPDEDEQSTSDAKTKSGASQVRPGTDKPDGSKNEAKYYVALFDYDPQHLSPNIDVDVEISFSRGDIITVFGVMDDDGFYKGKLGNKEGLVPSNFLEEISEQQVEALRQNSAKPQKKMAEPVHSPIPKPRVTQNNVSDIRTTEPTPVYPTTSSNVNPNRVDNTVSRKKGGFMSKGRKLFKRLGGSQDGKRR